MSAYPDIPEWGYMMWLILFALFSILVTQFTPFYMPVSVTIFAILLGSVTTIPFGLIQAVSGTTFYLQVLTQFIIGYILPGEPAAVACFTSLCSNIVYQALLLTADLKLGHYMHIDPYSLVCCQVF